MEVYAARDVFVSWLVIYGLISWPFMLGIIVYYGLGRWGKTAGFLAGCAGLTAVLLVGTLVGAARAPRHLRDWTLLCCIALVLLEWLLFWGIDKGRNRIGGKGVPNNTSEDIVAKRAESSR